MALKTFSPTSAGRRHLVLVDKSHLWKGGPVKKLVEGLNKSGGRNTHGRITSRLTDPETGTSFLEGVLPGEVSVPRAGALTVYARFGDWFAVSLLVLCAAVWGVRKFANRQARG